MTALRPVPSGDPAPEGTGVPLASPPLVATRPTADDGDALSDLLRRTACGDETAFAALYDATSPRVHGLVLRVVRDPAQAEEVAQEVFLQAWRTAGRYEADRGKALSWLLTIAHRRAVDRVRSAESTGRHDTTYHRTQHLTPHDETAEAAEASLELHRVRAALDTLTPVQREAVRLAYFGGYTHREVATQLDLPVGTVKTRIRDGLIRLRDALGVDR